MRSPEEENTGPVIRDRRRIDPQTGQVRDPGQSGSGQPGPGQPGSPLRGPGPARTAFGVEAGWRSGQRGRAAGWP